MLAQQAGRKVDLNQILQHELLPVPIALAEMNGDLRTATKALLAEAVTENIKCLTDLPAGDLKDGATLMIDGMALLAAIGKPQGIATFGDLSNSFRATVILAARSYDRVDVLFDRYKDISIKSGTRKQRSKGTRPVRRVIENRNVPLPNDWRNFLALPENKADLAKLLSEDLTESADDSKIVVTAGGFEQEEGVGSTSTDIDKSALEAHHEEADTRIVLHCMNSTADCIVVQARDTDILVLLLAHFHRFQCKNLWIKAGTAKKRKYIRVHEIATQLSSVSALLDYC